MNDTYEYATLQLISPETRTEPVIEPWTVRLHTHGFNAISQAIGRYFGRQDVAIESHLSCAEDGKVYQFQYLDRQADATGAANGFTLPGQRHRLFGALSMESEDRGDPRRPWSKAQVVSLGLWLAAMNRNYGIELRINQHAKDRAIGWHSQFDVDNPNRHNCPGLVRVRQIPEVIDVARWFASQSKPSHTDIVDELVTPDGHWRLQRDGGVLTVRGQFWGSYPGLPEKDRQGGPRWFKAISDFKGGYVLVSDTVGHDEWFHFPAKRGV